MADFIMDQGFLTLLDGATSRRVVPPSRRRAAFEYVHSGLLAGHFGPKKVMRQLSKTLFWEMMSRDITKWSKECRECLCHNKRHPMTPPLNPIVTTKPYELVGIDLLELGPTEDGNRYALSGIDHFTKYGGAYVLPSKAVPVVARVFFERWIMEGCRILKCVLSDQGGEFSNHLMDELKLLMGIEHVYTKGYNPRENGVTGRFNETIIGMLRKKVEMPAQWDKILPYCFFAYNTTVHDSTGESPFFLLHGFDAHIPWESVPDREIGKYMVDIESYAQEMALGTKIARKYAREVNARMRERMKDCYDRRIRVCDNPVKVGDRVYMEIPTEKQSSTHPKLTNPWEGPYRVVDISDSALVTLIHKDREPVRVPFDMLRKLPKGIPDEPLLTKKSRRKRRRPKKTCQ